MTDTPLISVIVPVYNNEHYLVRCLDSLRAQSYEKLEFILVDDGSTDGSSGVCKSYANQDNRFIVHHKENGGASSARNAGLDLASGDYIGFIDADDCAEPDQFLLLHAAMEEHHAEITVCGHFLHEGGRLVETRSVPGDIGILDLNTALTNLVSIRSFEGFLPNKLFATKLILRADNRCALRFDENIHICEDVLFVCKCMLAAKGIAYVPEPLYHYYLNPSGLSHTLDLSKRATEKDSWKQVAALLPPHLSKIAMERHYSYAFNVLRIAIRTAPRSKVAEIRKSTAPYLREYRRNRDVRRRNKLRAILIVRFPYLSDIAWRVVKKLLRVRWR